MLLALLLVSMTDDAEERLKQQRDDLRLLNQVMRHDIRNDLQLVSAYAELLGDHVDEEGEEYLDVIKANTRSAVALTTTVRDLAEVMLREDVDPGVVSLDRVLSQQVKEVRSAYSRAVFTVEGSVSEVEVVADEMLDSVFRNILRNAIQHNDKATPTVNISVMERDGTAVVSIADNGPGVPDDLKDDIFDKGEKGLESEGTGIGLYLVQTLVDSYGGDVWVEDRAGAADNADSRRESDDNDPEGAVFVVELPIAE